jgi:putative membrane protein
MNRFVIRIGAVALALLLAQEIIPGVSIDSLLTALLGALVLGVLNTLVRPLLILLTLPITILTLGLFIIVINVAMVAMAAWLLPGFTIDTILAAVLTTLLISVVSIVVERLSKE